MIKIRPDYNLKVDLLEEVEGRESLDLHAVADGLVFGGIDLGNGAGRVLGGENGGGTLVLGGQLLAVTTVTKTSRQIAVIERRDSGRA